MNQPGYLILWYEKPAIEWMTEALPIGNGYMGMMFFGGIGKEIIQLRWEDHEISEARIRNDRGNILKILSSRPLKVFSDGKTFLMEETEDHRFTIQLEIGKNDVFELR